MGKLIWGAIVTLVMLGTIARVFLWIDMSLGISTVEPMEETVALLNVAFAIFFINLIFTVAGNWVLHGRITLYKMFDNNEGTIRYTYLQRGCTLPPYIPLDEEGENARKRRGKRLFIGIVVAPFVVIIVIFIIYFILDVINILIGSY